jgi:hypothetical protein
MIREGHHGQHVVEVMLEDALYGGRLPGPEIVMIAGRHHVPWDVIDTMKVQEFTLQCAQACVLQACTLEATGEVEEVEVRSKLEVALCPRPQSLHDESVAQDRQVVALAVEGDEHGPRVQEAYQLM